MLVDLTPVVAQRELTRAEVTAAMEALLDSSQDREEKKSYLTAWARRGETGTELAAAAEFLLPLARDPGVRGSWNGQPLLDCCGTGGGGLNLINISTGIVFILAAMGIPVVKHGNRGVTKKSGSADVLEALGIAISCAPSGIAPCLEEVGAAFVFAPQHHPGFAAIADLRREMGARSQRTIFNLLGPLLNPAQPEARLIGVFKEEHVSLYQTALEKMGCPRFTVACGEYGSSRTKIGEVGTGTSMGTTITEFANPKPFLHELGNEDRSLEELLVQGARESAARLEAIFQGKDKGVARDLLVLNAAVAARTHNGRSTFADKLHECHEVLASGAAQRKLEVWRSFSARSFA